MKTLMVITTTAAFALVLGVSVATLGTTAANAGLLVDKSEIGGMSCHQEHQDAVRCHGWGR